jgi:hypothetical protein
MALKRQTALQVRQGNTWECVDANAVYARTDEWEQISKARLKGAVT